MNRSSVISTNIAEVGYDSGVLTLEIAFHSGITYQYFHVPEEIYQQLMNASSKGSFFNDYIKNKYRFRRI